MGYKLADFVRFGENCFLQIEVGQNWGSKGGIKERSWRKIAIRIGSFILVVI
jgi:hypothetical protein